MRHVMTREERSAKNIKAVRLRARMSQEQFAEALEVATNTISRIERGKTSVSAEVALKISEKFFVSMDYLFGRTPYEDGEPTCDKTCEDMLNAQNRIEMQDAIIKDLSSQIETIKSVITHKKTTIKLENPDCSV